MANSRFIKDSGLTARMTLVMLLLGGLFVGLVVVVIQVVGATVTYDGNSHGAIGTATGVGEHTMTLILAVLKQVVLAHNALVQGKWLQWALRPLTRDLEGKTLGLFGFGRTGRATAQRALGFGVRLLACDPYITLAPEERARYGGIELVSRERLLRESDIIVCHVPLTDETRHLVNRAFLAQMKPSAYLINISRGGVVDQDALVEALRDGDRTALVARLDRALLGLAVPDRMRAAS